jgi:chromosome segregation ATPase
MTVGAVDSLLRVFDPVQRKKSETASKAEKLFLRMKKSGELKLEDEGRGSRFINRVFRRCSYDFSTNIEEFGKIIKQALDDVACRGENRVEEICACIGQYQKLLKRYAEKQVSEEKRAQYYEEHSFRKILNGYLQTQEAAGFLPLSLIADNALSVLGRFSGLFEAEFEFDRLALHALCPDENWKESAGRFVEAESFCVDLGKKVPGVLESQYSQLVATLNPLSQPTEGVSWDTFASDLASRAEQAKRACAQYMKQMDEELQKEFGAFDQELATLQQKAAEVERAAEELKMEVPTPTFLDQIRQKDSERKRLETAWKKSSQDNALSIADWMNRWTDDLKGLRGEIEQFSSQVSARGAAQVEERRRAEEQIQIQEQARVAEAIQAYELARRFFMKGKAVRLQEVKEIEKKAENLGQTVNFLREIEALIDPPEAKKDSEPDIKEVQQKQAALEGISKRMREATEALDVQTQEVLGKAKVLIEECRQLDGRIWNAKTKDALGDFVLELLNPFAPSSKRDSWDSRVSAFKGAIEQEERVRAEILSGAKQAFGEFDRALTALNERKNAIASNAQKFSIQVGDLEAAIGALQKTKKDLPPPHQITTTDELESVSQWRLSWKGEMEKAQEIATRLESEIERARKQLRAEVEEASSQFTQYKSSLRSRAERLLDNQGLLQELDTIQISQNHQNQKALIEAARARLRGVDERIRTQEALRTAAIGTDKARALLATTALASLEGRWEEEGSAQVSSSALSPDESLVAAAQTLVRVQQRVSELEAHVPAELSEQYGSLREAVKHRPGLPLAQFSASVSQRAEQAQTALAAYTQALEKVTFEFDSARQEFEVQKGALLQRAREVQEGARAFLGQEVNYAQEIETLSVSEAVGLRGVQEARRFLEDVQPKIEQTEKLIVAEKQRRAQEERRVETQKQKVAEEARLRVERQVLRKEELRRQRQMREAFTAARQEFEAKKKEALTKANRTDRSASDVLEQNTTFSQRISGLTVPEESVDVDVVREKSEALAQILSEMGGIEEEIRIRRGQRALIAKTAPTTVAADRGEDAKRSVAAAAKRAIDPTFQNAQKLKKLTQMFASSQETFDRLQQQGRDLEVEVGGGIESEMKRVSSQIASLGNRLSDRETSGKLQGCLDVLESIDKRMKGESARLSRVQEDFQGRYRDARAMIERLSKAISDYQGTLSEYLSSGWISKDQQGQAHEELSSLTKKISVLLQQTTVNKGSVEALEKTRAEAKDAFIKRKSFFSGLIEEQIQFKRIQKVIVALKGRASDLERRNSGLQREKGRLGSTREDGIEAKIREIQSVLQSLGDRLEAAKTNHEQVDAVEREVRGCEKTIDELRRQISLELFLAKIDFLKRPETVPSSLYSSSDEGQRRFQEAVIFANSRKMFVPEFYEGSKQISYQQLKRLGIARQKRIIQVVEALCDRQEDIREIERHIEGSDFDRTPSVLMAKNYLICQSIKRIEDGMSMEEAKQLSDREKPSLSRFFEELRHEYESLAFEMDQKFVSPEYLSRRSVEGSARIDEGFRHIRASLPFMSVGYVDNYCSSYRLDLTVENIHQKLIDDRKFVRDRFKAFLSGSQM